MADQLDQVQLMLERFLKSIEAQQKAFSRDITEIHNKIGQINETLSKQEGLKQGEIKVMERMERDLEDVQAGIKHLEKQQDDHTKQITQLNGTVSILTKLVYGGVGLILVAVVTAILATVVKGS